MTRLALITPLHKEDYLTNTVIDGCAALRAAGSIEDFKLSSAYPNPFDISKDVLPRDEFVRYAKDADLILFFWGKGNTDDSLALEVNEWSKLAYIDGSEVGGDRRFDSAVQQAVLDGTYQGQGAIDGKVLARAALYFRREKPYLPGIVPLPFGIERRFVAAPAPVRDIDVCCVFGQETYPPLRRAVREETERLCRERGYSCVTKKLPREEFYAALARSRVGVSVGGGGFDTYRFWEVLGNGCALLTETVDVFPKGSPELSFDRIVEFGTLLDFAALLPETIERFRATPPNPVEYRTILERHSSAARVRTILAEAAARGIIRKL